MRFSRTSVMTGIALVATLAISCDNGTRVAGPTAPAVPSAMVLTSADLKLDSESVNGKTLARGYGEGKVALFVAEFSGPALEAGFQVVVEYSHSTGSMPGRFNLWDDGTHGDPVAADGEYCLEGPQDTSPGYRSFSRTGHYAYVFYGVEASGRMTNRMTVTVDVVQ